MWKGRLAGAVLIMGLATGIALGDLFLSITALLATA
jgi:hypothetical protein